MNSALLASLPRFDDDAGSVHPAERLKILLGQMKEASAPKPAAPAADTSVEEAAPPPEPDTAPTLAEAERLVADLSGLMGRIERESREQAMHVTQALAARLFPELSRRFLAEEIGAHIAKLVPASVPSVEIRAKAGMLEKLKPIIARNTALSARCSLVQIDAADEAGVHVSWKTGGITFDFEALLAACLAHLDPAQTFIEE